MGRGKGGVEVGLDDIVRASDGVLVNRIADETVLLNPATGRYYTLNDVATRMWSLLEEGQRVGAALETLVGEYDAPRERLERDLVTLVGELVSHELVTISRG